ncbi:MAG: tripartite tricarboxylate transporter TctB family protein [Rhodospirillales bacterium]|jgi:hypothetical protein|nr:hypothetical protein [Rhodospirillaceae bacterium]MAF49629.1 hypothetical protein [Rhodospirillaceae bacterium]MDP6428921.1 tripartite tricarboxylate transporter TctB family protein [Rhodospirillales bacterium]MDP6644948.1 tripartite tricarboxylate transporter TctB family protein [Rhodospirillales bacterium]MDP6840516.1 tripartite tricarboxylate transporter TctB family protein [Rhodospirillales bacterium]|tara:strand:- start:805 stop:1224 length:420 start_codon:yes stop_codon:yes gene_type:complete
MSLARVLGAASAVIGAGFLLLLIPWQTETVRSAALFPGTFPTVAAVLIIVSGIVQWAKPTGTAIFEPDKMLKAVYVVAFCLAGTLALELVGYLFAAPLLVGAVMLLSGERRWFWFAVGLIVLPTFIWFIFEIILRRPLP